MKTLNVSFASVIAAIWRILFPLNESVSMSENICKKLSLMAKILFIPKEGLTAYFENGR
jgi:hypothetical protein